MSKTVLILEGGWGGLTAAHALLGQVPKDYRIAVIEKRQSFVFYPSFLRVIIGEKPDLKNGEGPIKNLLPNDLEIINDEVVSINPEPRTVYTNAQTLQAGGLNFLKR
jgi:NADH dehydrogenase FAD-containing subunit